MKPSSQARKAAQGSTTFELLRHFSTASFVSILFAMVIVVAILSVFYRNMALRDLTAMAERQNVALTRAFANSLWPHFKSFLAAVAELSDDELRAHADIAELHAAVVAQMNGVSVLKIKIYDLQGRTVFSTEAGQIGENKGKNAGFLFARSGSVVSELTHRDTFSAFEGVIEDRDLISSYIPIRGSPAGVAVEAVFELYQDVTPLLKSIEETQKLLTLGVIVVLACLYLMLMFVVRRADKIIKRQESARQVAENDLAGRTKELERSYRDTQILHEIGCAILQAPDHASSLERILAHCLAARGFDVGIIRLVESGTQNYGVAAHLGYLDAANIERHHAKIHNGATGRLTRQMLASEGPVVEQDVQGCEGLRTFKHEGVRSAVAIPVRAENEILGVLQLGSRAPRALESEELNWLEAAGSLIGIAVQKFQLFDGLQSAKEDLKESVAELARSNRELEQFAYVASHDLQEPLRMITGYTSLLAKRYRGKLDKDADEFIGFAVDGAKRMQAIINDLLAYSRIGAKAKDFTPVDVELVFGRTLLALQVPIQECSAKITHDPLPTVTGDDVQLGRLIQNLVSNAIKYRNGNTPEVHVGCERRDKDWLFSVNDNGIGIAPQHAERIFQIFQRLHTDDKYQGTGIGLASCKKIVELHGGRIWVESESEKGSTFYFTLPA
jgi:signal transduction histidine kinase